MYCFRSIRCIGRRKDREIRKYRKVEGEHWREEGWNKNDLNKELGLDWRVEK
jgi:hypothetical protein